LRKEKKRKRRKEGKGARRLIRKLGLAKKLLRGDVECGEDDERRWKEGKEEEERKAERRKRREEKEEMPQAGVEEGE